MKITRTELKEFKISSNLISPFLVETPMIKKISHDTINNILKKKNKKKNNLNEVLKIVEKIMSQSRINSKNFYL